MGQGGLEPPTPRLSSVCSDQLSYWPAPGPPLHGKDARTAPGGPVLIDGTPPAPTRRTPRDDAPQGTTDAQTRRTMRTCTRTRAPTDDAPPRGGRTDGGERAQDKRWAIKRRSTTDRWTSNRRMVGWMMVGQLVGRQPTDRSVSQPAKCCPAPPQPAARKGQAPRAKPRPSGSASRQRRP
jgi:hypothetical protein